MLFAHVGRARAAGDDRDLADLTSMRHGSRMYYAGVGLTDARKALRQRRIFDAIGMLWWSITFSPAGVRHAIRDGVRRRLG
jgi:hypothetical protein